MTRLSRLPAVAVWLLCFTGACYSALASWALWLGHSQSNPASLESSLHWSIRLHLPVERLALRLADLKGENEEAFARQALVSHPSYGPALQRLALAAEFAQRKSEAIDLMEQSVRFHRTYATYVAASSQAVRLGRTQRARELVAAGLALHPNHSDDLFAVVASLADPASLLAGALPSQQADYLRYLISVEQYDAAAEYEQRLPEHAPARQYRLELSERLLLNGRQMRGAEVFARLYPGFSGHPGFNLDFAREPINRGYDWRLIDSSQVVASWRPYEITFEMQSSQKEVELLSQFVIWRKATAPQIVPNWDGYVLGLHWEAEKQGENLWRIRLRADPGESRRFVLRGVDFRSVPEFKKESIHP